MRRVRKPSATSAVSAISAVALLAVLPGAAVAAGPPAGPDAAAPRQHGPAGHGARAANAPQDYAEAACEGPPPEEGDVYTRPPTTSPHSTPPKTSQKGTAPQGSTPPQQAKGAAPKRPAKKPASRRALPHKWPRGVPGRDEAVRMLDDLTVRPFNGKGYDHRLFTGSSCWVQHGVDRCTTRQIALRFHSVTPVKLDGPCKVVGGEWHSEYDGRTMADPLHLDVDHVVPLRNAWGSGASAWSFEERREFANDLVASPQLIVVSTWSNRAKGDKGPDQWLPKGAECTYSRAWIGVKDYYRLSVTRAEKDKLRQVLDTCPL
ncbi:hypothetical protein BLA24_15735 [Streptomyces cinnamoneus]|uniref:GmrSD restriction endonucleases C-terminal domain-containing protein n=1 Tax=Streptomyces cinnamoneus TaxID=53446 RepID=A0A2G1XJ02_STRCJ|nr:HNH endonuclease family protein [Streptomyces cinnamoneus]PHQ51205.1 hypothetical protein BLA24_15735 [Streptomyces cinnamoneus]PPT13571.1 DUF1524 domain-containing protein [Streptomyces cinnamoneus]